jgi:hypothetical protein
MKVTIVAEGNNVVGYQVVTYDSPTPGQFRAGLIAGPGQKIHEVEVGEDFPLVANPEEVHKRLAAHIHKKAA